MILRTTFDSLRFLRSLSLVVLLFSTTALGFAALPGTVLADSAAEQYIEPQLPEVEERDIAEGEASGSTRSDGGSSAAGAGASDGTQGTGSQAATDGQGGSVGEVSSGAEGEPGSGEENQGRNGQSTGSDRESGEQESEDSAAALFSSDGGGPGLGLIVALFVLFPLIAAGGYFALRRYRRVRDEPTRSRLRTAVSGTDGRANR